MADSEMWLLSQSLGPVIEILLHSMSKRQREAIPFPVGTTVEQKNIPYPKENFSNKIPCPNLEVMEIFLVQSQNTNKWLEASLGL